MKAVGAVRRRLGILLVAVVAAAIALAGTALAGGSGADDRAGKPAPAKMQGNGKLGGADARPDGRRTDGGHCRKGEHRRSGGNQV